MSGSTPLLFTPFTLRELTLRNRVMVAPMCQYSCGPDGALNDWHLMHLGARAAGGAGLVMVEATAVQARGRLSLGDSGLWDDAQVAPLRRVLDFVKARGAATAVQLAHGGRKAWSDKKGNWSEPGREAIVAPSALPFDADWATPHELSAGEIDGIVASWSAAARRALAAGADCVEIHSAHGYLLHSFLSPLCNRRADEYGGSLENRARLPRRIARELRALWPARMPLLARLSCDDWAAGGFTIDEAVTVSRWLKEDGVDLVDCSSGGAVPFQQIAVGPGYQVPFSARIRREAELPTAAVGMITTGDQAESILQSGDADLIALARIELYDPHWPLHAARQLGLAPDDPACPWPVQYGRALSVLPR